MVDEIPYEYREPRRSRTTSSRPNLAKRGIGWTARRASIDMALFNMEHPLVGGYTPEKVALRRAIGARLRSRARSGSCARASRFPRSRPSRR